MTKQNDVKAEGENKEVENTLQRKLSEQMIGIFDLVITDRSNHFTKHPDKIPDKNSGPFIINSYSVANAAISGGASLVPGPWGMIAVVPEIAAVIRNQLAMIYDIGMAYGKINVLTKELLAGVLLTAMGSGAGSLLVMQGSKVLVRRATLRTFQKIITMLAGRVTQQAIKSTISKFLPIVGSAAMAVWSNYITRQVGKKAVEIFEKEIVVTADIVEDIPLENEPTLIPNIPINRASTLHTSPDMPKVQTLINLIKVDGTIKAEERDYIYTIIGNAELTTSEKVDLMETIDKSGRSDVDYTAIANCPDDAIGLMVAMTTLAKRDGTFHITEKLYIKQIGKLLGFSENDIDEVITTEG